MDEAEARATAVSLVTAQRQGLLDEDMLRTEINRVLDGEQAARFVSSLVLVATVALDALDAWKHAAGEQHPDFWGGDQLLSAVALRLQGGQPPPWGADGSG